MRSNQRGRSGRTHGPDLDGGRGFGDSDGTRPGERGGRPRRGGEHHGHEHGERRGRGPRGPRGFGGPGFRPGGPGFGPGGPGFFGPFGGPAGFGDPFGGRRGARRGPGRGRRGDVRNAILALLAEEPMNGYQVIAAIAERTEGLWRPSAGSVYPALGLLEDEGLIAQSEKDGKKAFELTEAGTAYVAEHAEELTDPWNRVASPHEGFLDVRQEIQGLMMAVGQVVQAGDPTEVAKAKRVLADAKRSLYRILAGDDPSDPSDPSDSSDPTGHTGTEAPTERVE